MARTSRLFAALHRAADKHNPEVPDPRFTNGPVLLLFVRAMIFDSASGILLHPTALPGPYGIGEFGQPVIDWLDQLVAMGQTFWQVLPLGPTGYGDSPYQSPSSFAGNPLLISIGLLCEEGWLTREEVEPLTRLPSDHVQFEPLIPMKTALLHQAARRVLALPDGHDLRRQFRSFCESEAWWLDDFAVFASLKERHDLKPWFEWPAPDRNQGPGRRPFDLTRAIEQIKVLQFLFHEQWQAMRGAAQRRGIRIIGDIPIFVAHDSAEVWASRDLFQLDAAGQPTVVAGVPPDYFAVAGQRWGNPLYEWAVHQADDFAWWRRRIGKALDLYDAVRVDHFRGFVDYWEIPASEPTAIKGHWRPAPGRELFTVLREEFGDRLQIIAEDLGVMSRQVDELRDAFGFPGMRVLQFAFGTDPRSKRFLPQAYVRNCVACTGTHDNDTIVGWFNDKGTGSLRSAAQCERERRACLARLGIPGREIHWEMIEVLLRSQAGAVIFPLQDVLGLGTGARMNTPGTATGNWRWRLKPDQLTTRIQQRLGNLVLQAKRKRPPL